MRSVFTLALPRPVSLTILRQPACSRLPCLSSSADSAMGGLVVISVEIVQPAFAG